MSAQTDVGLDRQKLSGQIRETSTREMLCLTMSISDDKQVREATVRRLHELLARLYHGTRHPTFAAIHRWAEDAGAPEMPTHPALPFLVAITSAESSSDPGLIRM